MNLHMGFMWCLLEEFMSNQLFQIWGADSAPPPSKIGLIVIPEYLHMFFFQEHKFYFGDKKETEVNDKYEIGKNISYTQL